MHSEPNVATLSAYLDGELPLEQAEQVKAHLRTCPRCTAELAELALLQRSMRVARTYHTPSVDFRRKLQAQIRDRPKRRLWTLLIPSAGLVTLLLVLLIARMPHPQTSAAYAELADLHVNALASSNMVDVVSTDRHTVKPWFQGKIPFSFNIPEFSGTEYSLLGGRLVYFHQRPGAQLIVALRQHKISVLIFQESGDTAALPQSVEAQRRSLYEIESWRSQDLRFVVIGDADPASIDKLTQAFKLVNE